MYNTPLFWLAGRDSSMQLFICVKQTVRLGLAMIGPCSCCLNLTGQFQLSKMAAQLSESELGLEILLSCDVTTWDSPRITVHAGKIGQIF